MATVSERFPEQYWLHVCTDGSAIGADCNAGAEVYSRRVSLRTIDANFVLTMMVKWLLSISH